LPLTRTSFNSMIFRLTLIILTIFALNSPLLANPNQFGSSGLLNIPTADTLDSANFCFGLWGNCSSKADTGVNSIMPVTITLGLGTFWEVYGTYPNVMLNNDAPDSGRGTADIGMKLRVVGARSSKFKLAVDTNLSRSIDDDPKYNGVNDVGGKVIATLRSDLLATHLYAGYMSNGKSRAVEQENPTKSSHEYPVGFGIDYKSSSRTKMTFEFTAADATSSDAPLEATIGFQYYVTPHLTFNLAYSMGLNDAAADWRVLSGLSTCQGVGNYVKPIPVVRRKGEKNGTAELIKPTKIIILSPLLIKTPALTTPVSQFEVPVDSDGEEILIRPYGNIVIPQKPAARSVTIPTLIATEATSPQLPIVASTEEGKVSGVTPLYGVSSNDQVTPIEETATPVTVYRKFRVPDYLFEFDSIEMAPEVQRSVSELAEYIRKDTKWVFLRINGHTDAVGSVKYNKDLSLKRAITIAGYLITHEGIDPSRIFVSGMGKSSPIADNSTDEGRKLNRRVEVELLVHKDEKPK